MLKKIPSQLKFERWKKYAVISLGLGVPALVLGKTLIFISLALPTLVILRHSLNVNWHSVHTSIKENRWLVYLAATTATLWFLSSALSHDAEKSLPTWIRTILLFPFFFLLVDLIQSRENLLSTALKSLIASSMFVLLAANFSLYVDTTISDFYAAFFENERVAALLDISPVLLQMLKPFYSVAACALPIVLWAGFRIGGVWRAAGLAAAPLTVILLYGNGQQPGLSAAFGLVAALAAFGLLLFARLLPIRATIAAFIILVLLAGLLAAYVLTSLPTPPVSSEPMPRLPVPDWHRQVIWGFSLDVALRFPWLGIGPNTINLFPGASEIIPGMNQEYVPSHPHNWFLEIFVETGFLGTISFLASMLIAVSILFKRAIRKESPAIAAITLLASFWCASLGNFSIWSIWWLATLGVLLSFPLAAIRKDERDAN